MLCLFMIFVVNIKRLLEKKRKFDVTVLYGSHYVFYVLIQRDVSTVRTLWKDERIKECVWVSSSRKWCTLMT